MTPAQLTALLAAIGTSQVAITGTIIMYGSTATPSGYLPCDGAAVNRITNAALFATIGIAFGAGDASTTFNVPDMRSRLPMGVGAGPGLTTRALAAQGGAEGTVVAQANLAAFNLVVSDTGHNHAAGGGMNNYVTDAAGTEYLTTGGNKGAPQAGTDTSTTGVTVASGGGATALPTVDPFTTVGYFIKT